MSCNILFVYIIYLLVFVSIIAVVKTIFSTIKIQKKAFSSIKALQQNLVDANTALKLQNDNIYLAETMTKTLVLRMFKIATELLSIQKLIFNSKET